MLKVNGRKGVLRVIATLLCAIAVTPLIACKKSKKDSSSQSEAPTAVTWVLGDYEKALGVDETFQMQAFDSAGNPLTDIVWQSNDVLIATVSETGEVCGKKSGKTEIKGTYMDRTLVCTVTVAFSYTAVPVLSLNNVLDGEIILKTGDTFELDPTLKCNGTTVENTFTATSENSAVTVDGLTLTANAVAENVKVTISCAYEGKTYSLECFVTVTA